MTTGDYNLLVEGSQPQYIDGWLIPVNRQTAVAQRFDVASGTLQGPVIPLAKEIPTPSGRGQLAVSGNTFVYRTRAAESTGGLLWADAAGNLSQAVAADLPGWDEELSRDGSRIASGGWGLWVVDTEGGLPRRLTGAGNVAFTPRWSEDASTVAYTAADGLRTIGTSPGDSAILIVPSPAAGDIRPVGWGPAGELLFIENFADGSSKLRVKV